MKKLAVIFLLIIFSQSIYPSERKCININEMQILKKFYIIETYRSIEEIEKTEVRTQIGLRKFIKKHGFNKNNNPQKTILPFEKQREKWKNLKKYFKKGNSFSKISYDYQYNTFTDIILLKENCILSGFTYSQYLTHRKLPLIKNEI